QRRDAPRELLLEQPAVDLRRAVRARDLPLGVLVVEELRLRLLVDVRLDGGRQQHRDPLHERIEVSALAASLLRLPREPAAAGGAGEQREQVAHVGARQPPVSPLYVPRKSARGVRARIFRSSSGERCSTYQTSSSIRSAHGSAARPLICAQPVMPGRTSSRWRWRSSYCSTW